MQKIQTSNRQQQDEQQAARPTYKRAGRSGDRDRSGGNDRGSAGAEREAASAHPVRDTNVELLAAMLEQLSGEHDCLYHSLLLPITAYVMEILPEHQRETTRLELSFDDMENLLPDDVARIVEWLTEKVDALSTKLKPEPKEDEVSGPGDWETPGAGGPCGERGCT